MLNTPILLLIFNRPETTALVFEQIRAIKPKRLYVGADGPRLNNRSDSENCERARQIATSVDWDCDVKTLFRKENLGCGIAVTTAIDWYFEQEENGIVLEDDTVPNLSFFRYCEEQLERHKNNSDIGIISGNNVVNHIWPVQIKDDFLYSGYTPIWGWASTRKNWQTFDYSLKSLDKNKLQNSLSKFFSNEEIVSHWMRIYKIYLDNGYNNWDFRFFLNQVYKNKLHIIPKTNLVKNIGFGENSTHTSSKENILNNLETFDFKPRSPAKKIIQNKKHDLILSEYAYGIQIERGVLHRAYRKLSRGYAKVIHYFAH